MEGSGERASGRGGEGSGGMVQTAGDGAESGKERKKTETEEGRKKGLEERDSLAQFQSANNS